PAAYTLSLHDALPISRSTSLISLKRAGTWLSSLVVAPVVCEYAPVKKLARDGRHRALVTKALRNRTPSRAMRSMFGVFSSGLPQDRKSTRLNSSHRTI